MRQYLAAEISLLERQLLPGYTVNGKIGAVPYQIQTGVLEYRTDLLTKYGYDHPPRTWDELEGSISPPAVLAYREFDSMNTFDSGEAAFDRVWGGATVTRGQQFLQAHWRSSQLVGKTAFTSIPGGPGGRGGTLGGSGLDVSRHSLHTQDALELVRFLVRAQIRSDEPGRKYEDVTMAYIDSLHSVLEGHQGAAEPVAELEQQLIKITGLSMGPPRKLD